MRRPIALWRILCVLASVAALAIGSGAATTGAAFAAPAVLAATAHKSQWKPKNLKGEQAYWSAREGKITPALRAQWLAQIAGMPHASSLPPVVRAGSSSLGYLAGGPSGPWQTMGPNPIDASGGGVPPYAGRV